MKKLIILALAAALLAACGTIIEAQTGLSIELLKNINELKH